MNKAIIMGNLTRDPELRSTNSGTPVASFTLAVERRFKDANGERQADFINCTAWRQTAEFVSKYFVKGSRMIVVGSIQTRSYEDKDGNKRTATEVVADEIYFGEKRNQNSGAHEQQEPQSFADQIPSGDETILPFDL